ncbi:extracellular solute-binding protein [Rhizobium rhizogenes]|jgi:ABC-type glycerol-3-phosphate transport system substrate-binding protein|uniref:extracellular solute-binding protein n=1 Tax=Rhizobium rhizogenes TaxID=359 RepID=UPI0022BB85A6|nr:extracellular solute-binding protein [Rhizobium rhizogenes]MCZ7463985.1 extracellular solute-binding protein [Rhizobium rhizogenes]
MIRLSTAIATISFATLSTFPAAAAELRFVSGQEKQNGAVLKQIFETYNGSNPASTVNLELDNKSDLDTTQKVMADIVAGTTPDAVRVTGAVLRAYVDSGRAQPLDSCLASAPELAAQLDKGLVDNFRINGKLYAMPWYVTLPALFINADAFKAAGLDMANPPKTWSELEAAAARLSNKADNKFGVLMYMPNTYMFEGQLTSAGGTMVAANGKSGVGGPAAVEVMSYMRRLVDKGYMPAVSPGTFWGEAGRMFQAGETAMLLTSSSGYTGLVSRATFKVALAPMPAKDGTTPLTMASGNGFVMLTTDPARQEATCKALLSLVSPESVAQTVKATASSPINTTAAAKPELLGEFYEKNPELKIVNTQRSQNWYTLPGKANNEFQANFGDIQYEILTGATTAEAGMQRLSGIMNDLNAAK